MLALEARGTFMNLRETYEIHKDAPNVHVSGLRGVNMSEKEYSINIRTQFWERCSQDTKLEQLQMAPLL